MSKHRKRVGDIFGVSTEVASIIDQVGSITSEQQARIAILAKLRGQPGFKSAQSRADTRVLLGEWSTEGRYAELLLAAFAEALKDYEEDLSCGGDATE